VSRPKPAIVFVLITLFLDILGIGLIIPILPKLIEQLSGGDVSSAAGTMGLLVALYSLMQFLCAPVLGSLSDRFGRRPVILGSLFGSGMDYLLLAWAPNVGWFFLGRIVAGITGANISATSAYIADVSPPEKRAQSFGLIGAAFGLGFIMGPMLGSLLGGYGLRVPFLVAAGLTLVNWLYGMFVLPESLTPEHRRAFSWSRANPVGSLLALRKYPVVVGLAMTLFLVYFAQYGLQSTWVLYTSYRYHWTLRQIGLSLAIVGIMAAVVQGGLSRVLIPKMGERRAVVMGMSISIVNLALYGLATQGWMVYTVLVLGALNSIAGPALQGLVSRSVAMNEQGAVQGSLSSIGSVAGVLGPLVSSSLFGYFISPRAPVQLPGAPFFLGVLLTATGLGVALRSFRKTPAPSVREPETALAAP